MRKTGEIHLRDPFVLTHEGKYYLYGTRGRTAWSAGSGFDVFVSENLEDWDGPYPIFENDGSFPFWATKNFWAPEVHSYKGAFYLFASFKSDERCRGTQILKADSPVGPFVPLTEYPVTPENWECLDGTLYVSPSGIPYMVFCHEWVQIADGEICAIELSDDLTRAAGAPFVLFRATENPYVTGGKPKDPAKTYVTDGPFLYRTVDGTLLLLWSSFYEKGYMEAVAVSSNGDITGKWSQSPDLLAGEDGGHGMIFRTFNNQLMLTLHQPNRHPDERPVFIPLREQEGRLVKA